MNQQDILTRLNNDCLIEIFRYFKDDPRTLHSCALVNKNFCELAIPLLWHNPFSFTRKIYNKVLLIRTYLCLIIDDSTKFRLKIHKLPKPFFEYHKFLREFELSSFQLGLREFVRQEVKLDTSTNLNKKINKIVNPLNIKLGNLLLNKDNNLSHLNIHYTEVSKPENQLNLCILNEIDDVLLNINKFSLEFSMIESYSEPFLEMITMKKKNLHHLSLSTSCIKNTKIYNALIKLLVSQQNLKTLKIPLFWTPENTDLVLNSFHNFSNSLISLNITNRIMCVTLFSLLDILKNLRNFEVSSLSFNEDDEIFLNSSIPANQYYQLENLIFSDQTLLYFRNPLYRIVFERVNAMSTNNIIIPEIYIRSVFNVRR